MKLKTRLKIAWLELSLAALLLVGVMCLEAVRPHPAMSLSGAVTGALLQILLLAPMCVASWRRLKKTRAQLTELGPDAEPSADLWTAPGAPGVLAVMIVVAAVAAALAPALLLHA